MIRLSAEETILLLGSRPHLAPEERERLGRLIARPLDWAYILWRAETYQTLPLLRAHLAACEGESHLPDEIRRYMANWSAVSAARSIEQFRQLGEIVALLQKERIDHYLLKGAAIAAMLYPDPFTRPMQDLDIMIRPQDARRVQRLMYRLGYRHGVFLPEDGRFHHLFRKVTATSLAHNHALHSMTKVIPIAAPLPEAALLPEWRRRQIKCAFNPDGSVALPVFVDFHVSLAAGMDQIDVWRGASARDLLGQRVEVQSITTMLWFSAMRVYREAFEYNTLKLQMLGDIDALLRVHGDAVDWAELLAIAEKYELQPSLFYVLSQARDLQGAYVPEAVLAMLAPDRLARPAPFDLGDIVPKLLSRTIVNRFALAG